MSCSCSSSSSRSCGCSVAVVACAFLTSQLPKVVQDRRRLSHLTCKRASRHNGVHFSDLSSGSFSSLIFLVLSLLTLPTSAFPSVHMVRRLASKLPSRFSHHQSSCINNFIHPSSSFISFVQHSSKSYILLHPLLTYLLPPALRLGHAVVYSSFSHVPPAVAKPYFFHLVPLPFSPLLHA